MDKFIDKLVDTKWFMKIIALVLALLLFDSVYNPDKDVSNINVPGEQDTEVISNVPVKSYYDTENLFVTGVPETVEVTLEGPKNVLQPAKMQRNFEVYVDLSDAEIGTERVPIKIRNISDKLKVTINPSNVNVKIQEKVTREFSVDVEFNKALLEEGYISEAPTAEPDKVKVTGAKNMIDSISYVKATVNLEGSVKDTVRRQAQVLVFDRNMNKLDVAIDHDTIDVIIPVKSLSKNVPIKVVEKGSPPNNVKINSINLEVNEAKIFANQAVLDKVDSVRVEVDLSKIDADGDIEQTLPVIISEGILEVNPKTVNVTINATKEETEETAAETAVEDRTFSHLPIQLSGLSEQYEALLQSPANGASLTVSGTGEKINQLKANDFQLYLDLANLAEGEHEVKINVKGPADVNWKLASDKAKVSISQKEA